MARTHGLWMKRSTGSGRSSGRSVISAWASGSALIERGLGG
jgi:hypothetical protein